MSYSFSHCSDQLYLLNADLSLSSNLSWPSRQSVIDECITTVGNYNPVHVNTLFQLPYSLSLLSLPQSYACHNHVRVYRQFPGLDLLLVCGSNAAVDPLCRTVELQDRELGTAHPTVTASDGLVSYFPEYSGFGEFRNGITMYAWYVHVHLVPDHANPEAYLL